MTTPTLSPALTWLLLFGLVLLVVGVLTVLMPRRGARVDDRPSWTPPAQRTSAPASPPARLRLVGGDEPTRGGGSSPLHLTARDTRAALLLPDDEWARYVARRGSMARHPAGRSDQGGAR